MPDTITTPEARLAEVRKRYQKLAEATPNPHADPALKSLRMVIAKLEKQVSHH